MKIQILSDLHTEFKHCRVKVAEGAELLVIAGDHTVAGRLEKISHLSKTIKKPVVFVAENHDYYYGVFDAVNKELEEIDSNLDNFFFLNNRAIRIGEVTCIGSTLWSNFDLAPIRTVLPSGQKLW